MRSVETAAASREDVRFSNLEFLEFSLWWVSLSQPFNVFWLQVLDIQAGHRTAGGQALLSQKPKWPQTNFFSKNPPLVLWIRSRMQKTQNEMETNARRCWHLSTASVRPEKNFTARWVDVEVKVIVHHPQNWMEVGGLYKHDFERHVVEAHYHQTLTACDVTLVKRTLSTRSYFEELTFT